MIIASDWLLAAGYEGLAYGGGGDLTPEERLEAELQGMYMRTLRWSSRATRNMFPPISITRKPYLVAAEVQVVDGVRGGVSPQGG